MTLLEQKRAELAAAQKHIIALFIAELKKNLDAGRQGLLK